MNWSESVIYGILSEKGEGWEFFKNYDEYGKEVAQFKIYDEPYKISFPDFQKKSSGKIVLLVEVKGYDGYYNNGDSSVGMLDRQFRHYMVVQNKEKAEVRVAFVVSNEDGSLFFWETLSNIYSFERQYDNIWNKYSEKFEKCVMWSSEDFRTDIENLGQ